MNIVSLPSIDSLAARGYEKRERILGTISGQKVDRPPVCFWKHFSPNGSSGKIAINTVNFFVREHDQDIAKVMLDIPYPFPRKSINSPEEWRMLHDWGSIDNDFSSAYVNAVRQVRTILGPAYPLLLTVYSPTTWALLFGNERARLRRDLESSPASVHAALGNIALNLRRLVAACISAGADGVFYSSHGCDPEIPQSIYNEIGRPYDLLVLEAAQKGWLNLMHVHSDHAELRIEDVLDYPVCGFSWADRKSGRSIASVRAITNKCLMGGWDRSSALLTDEKAEKTLLYDTLRRDASDANLQACGHSLILAPGCTLPATTTAQALASFRSAADGLKQGNTGS